MRVRATYPLTFFDISVLFSLSCLHLLSLLNSPLVNLRSLKKDFPRLRELVPAAKSSSQDAGSRTTQETDFVRHLLVVQCTKVVISMLKDLPFHSFGIWVLLLSQ